MIIAVLKDVDALTSMRAPQDRVKTMEPVRHHLVVCSRANVAVDTVMPRVQRMLTSVERINHVAMAELVSTTSAVTGKYPMHKYLL